MPAAASLDRAHCWTCGYPLRGAPTDPAGGGVCPECGGAFSQADRATVNFGRPMGRGARRALGGLPRAVTWVSTLGAALAGATFR